MPCHATCSPEQHCVTSSTVAAKGRKSFSLILFEKVLALTYKSNSHGLKLACLMFSLFEYLVTQQWLVREGGRGGGFVSSSKASPHINPMLKVKASPSLSFSAYFSLNSTTCNVTKQTNQINQCRGSNVSFNFLFTYLFTYLFIFIFQHGSSRHVPKCIGV